MNHTSIYRVFSMCLCNLNARFTPIFLNITLIPHLLMFCKIKRKIKQENEKKLRRKNLLFEALNHHGEEVCQGEGCFAAVKPEPNKREPLGFAKAKEGHNKRQLSGSPWRRISEWNNKLFILSPSLAHFPFTYKYMYYRLVEGSVFGKENTLLRVSPLFFLSHSTVFDFVPFYFGFGADIEVLAH